MIAHKHDLNQKPQFVVKPAQPEHGEAIQQLAGIAYGIDAGQAKEWFAADQYRSRITHFSEGQFVALDDGKVVGITSSMRFQHNPDAPFFEDWDHTTGYG